MKGSIATQHIRGLTTLLRDSVFALQPQDIGLKDADGPQVWGVVMESGFPRLTVSLVALADGSVSIYMSDGGIIGCGLEREVRLAAGRMIDSAQPFADVFPVTQATPPPANGITQFYLLTRTGLRRTAMPSAQLDEGESELAKLYWAGHRLIETVETLNAGHDLLDEMLANDENEPRAGLRGRGCRIPLYVGNAVRRSHS
jgi:hypothetical protein